MLDSIAGLIIRLPRPASLLAAEYHLSPYVRTGFPQIYQNTRVGLPVQSEVPINERLRSQLHLDIVAVDHEHKVLVVLRWQRPQGLVDADDLGQMGSVFNEAIVMEALNPVDDDRGRLP